MRKIMLVAWREFKHTALTKAFIIAAVLAPLAISGLMFFMPSLMKTRLAPLSGTIAVVDPSGKLAPVIAKELKPERIFERRTGSDALGAGDLGAATRRASSGHRLLGTAGPPQIDIKVQNVNADEDLDAIKDRVRKRELVALVVIPQAALSDSPESRSNRFELFVASDASPHHTEMFENAIGDSIIEARVQSAGMNLDQARALTAEPQADVRRLSDSGGESREFTELKMFIPIAFMMLLWICTFTSGNYLLTSTIEEKSNKVMEVLLSAVSPFQLMAGKILGQAGVSAIMLFMYAGLGIAAMFVMAKLDLIAPILLLWLILYFIMAFFMIASIMAGVGSAVSELRDAQSLITPAMLVLMIPLLLWFPISNDPNGVLATITSFIPPLIPFVMILRVTTATEPVPLWQIIGSLVAGYSWMIVMVWMCGKIFRVGVLMYGKPPTPLELLKWVRYR